MTLPLALRRVLSVLLLLPAVALLPVALGSWWLDAVVADTEGYVEAVGPLAERAEVRSAVASRVEPAVVRAVDVPGRAEQLRRQIGRPALSRYERRVGEQGTAALQAYVEDAAGLATTRVVESPAFEELWRASNRSAHAALMDLLEDAPGTGADAVSIDLRPVVDAALVLLRAEGLVTTRSTVESTVTGFSVAGSEDLDLGRSVYQRVDSLGLALPLTCAALLALALLVSPLRRRTAVVAGLMALFSVGVLALTLVAARSFLQSAVDPGETRMLVLNVWDALLGGLWTAVVATLVVSAVVALVPLVVRRRNPTASQLG
ncbi:hypothetical protein BKA08_001498 [Nocardioides marinisabuli]|uniref:Integral membrane protein n=1 Tax=Nocardioides marinisabuli TaxID=419476 RepID=A0A7Y9F1Y9_9ACTN|nr:hypothetical protein [Nocardioides marinisabuli]NYD57260.1 hypothetical protein [Nocardioides marinisabuli]